LDTAAECPEKIELTDATRELLRKRLAAYRANPEAGSPWEDVKRRILGMLAAEFANADMTCIIENIFEDGDWAKRSFLRVYNLPFPQN